VDTSRVSLRAFDSAMHLVRRRKWPIVRASVLSADSPPAGRYGCTVVTAYYKHPVLLMVRNTAIHLKALHRTRIR
jgi:hypothetical protein